MKGIKIPCAGGRSFERIAYVLQGGGALGAYQIGVVKALHESKIYPDCIAGISIGAINAAIIAGNSPDQQIDKLNQFWDSVVTKTYFDAYGEWHTFNEFYNQLGANSALLFGQPEFFTPRVSSPIFSYNSSPDQISFYDTSEMAKTLEKFIDFERLNHSHEVHLHLGAVQIRTGRLVYFNNIDHVIGPEHIMASAALPPAFPAVNINGELYWDGGVYSNTPIAMILHEQPPANTLCFVINCFSPIGQLPTNLDDLLQREKDIRYSSHAEHYINLYTERENLRCAISELGKKIPQELKTDPNIKALLSLGKPHLMSIVQLVYDVRDSRHSFKDYNFAKDAIESHKKTGYKDTIAVLKEHKWEEGAADNVGAVVYDAPNNPK